MDRIVRGFKDLLQVLPQVLSQIFRLWPTLKRFLSALCRLVRRLCRPRPRREGCCVDIPPSEYKRPDPLLYSQTFLMKQGLSVTWDNPDIRLYDGGNPVSSSSLTPDHDYEVVVRVWNNSYYAPAAGLPVHLSYLGFGIGNGSTAVGKVHVDLGVKGSSQCPAFAKFIWHTPAQPGHYCLQALLDWPDDANPENNMGQENTNVGQMQSPARFQFTVRNAARVARRFELEVDMYRLPPPPQCPPAPQGETPDRLRAPRGSRLAESTARWARARAQQGYGQFGVTGEWKVDVNPRTFSLQGGEERVVEVSIEHVAGAFAGRQPFNVHGFATGPDGRRALAGGVTLIVEGT